MGHLFISYSRRDAEFVDRLVAALEQYGFRTWKDVNAIVGGEVWKASISRAVRECDAFLVVLSPQSAGSPNVAKELAVGTKHGRVILPVLYQPCEIPDKMDYDLAELQWVNFSEGSFGDAFEKLVRALGGQTSQARAATDEVRELGEFLARMASAITPSPLKQPKPRPAPPLPDPSPPPRPPAAAKFCIHCSAKLTPGFAFCTGCGKPVKT
jgi:hypothetical protein